MAASEHPWARVNAAVLRRPGRGDLLAFVQEAAWLFPLLLLLGHAGDLMRWNPVFDARMLQLALVAIIAPALGEELLFRAALLPGPERGRPLPLKPLLLSILLFVLWHPVQAPIFGAHWAEVVLNPWFLAAVAAFGLASARLYWKSGSLWPSVALHWLVVVAWKALLDGSSPWPAS